MPVVEKIERLGFVSCIDMIRKDGLHHAWFYSDR